MPGDPSLTSEPPLAYRPATELVAMIRARQLAARELTEHYLARIERLDAPLRSNVAVLAERALQEAAAADERTMAGGPTGPLHGVPVTIKDFNRFAGTPTTMGTRSLAGWVAEADDAVVARLRGAGAIVIGKTNVPEFGTIGHTDTALHGPCATPWDLTCNAGGSSGGAGAGLAAGRCGLAQGSDAGGSIRIPAAVNGLVGLKPARDRVSNAPLLGDLGFGLVTSGALTRTVADAALALDVLAGYEPGDPGQAPPPVRPFVQEVGGDVGRLRIGIDRQTLLTPGGLHASVEAALDATVEVLSGLGHDLEELTLPVPPTIGELMLTVWAADLAAQPVDPSTFEPVNVWLAQVGRTRRAAEAAAAPYRLQLLARGGGGYLTPRRGRPAGAHRSLPAQRSVRRLGRRGGLRRPDRLGRPDPAAQPHRPALDQPAAAPRRRGGTRRGAAGRPAVGRGRAAAPGRSGRGGCQHRPDSPGFD